MRVIANVRQHMAPQLKLGIIGVVGLLAPMWWTWTISQATYAIYVASGSPERPTRTLLWASVYAPSLILGIAAGVAVGVLSATTPLKGWLIFIGALVVGSVLLGTLVGSPAEHLSSVFASVGNWLFLIGSMLWPLLAHARKRAV